MDGASTETIPAVAQGPEFPTEPTLPATSGSRSRTVKTPFGPYQLPPLDLFRTAPPSDADARAEKDTLAALERTLHTFGVDARVVGAHRGPTVTMYEVAVASGTKVQKVVGLSSDISYALASPDVRIQAPIPGKSRDRDRGPQQAPGLRDGRRRLAFARGEAGDPSARGRARQGRPRPRADGQPRGHAAPADRRRDRRGEVLPRELLHHLVAAHDHPRTSGWSSSTRSASSSATSATCRTCCPR